MKITDAAKEKIIDVLTDEKSTVLRFGLQGGGCNGLQYFFAVEAAKEEGDTEYPITDTLMLVVDAMSSMYLEGAEIDYKKDLMGENFVFTNPNTSSKCGCGSSVGF